MGTSTKFPKILISAVTGLIDALFSKVDKVTGKGLSTNDYTDADKNRLANTSGTNTGNQDLSSYATITALADKRSKDVRVNLNSLVIDASTGNDFFCTLSGADSFSISYLPIGFAIKVDAKNNTASSINITLPNASPWKVDDDLVTDVIPPYFSRHYELEDDGTNKWFRIGNFNKAKA